MPKVTIDVTSPVRADKFVAGRHPEFSRAAIVKLFDKGLVLLDGNPIQPGHKLRSGSVLDYDTSPLDQRPDSIDLPIIYEDDDVVVINKPSGVISHARGKHWQEASVASFLREHVASQITDTKQADILFEQPDTTSTSLAEAQQQLRAGIVHRLDRATSGVMICAKNQRTYTYLQDQFAARAVQKTYVAVTSHTPKEPTAKITAPIDRDQKDPKKFAVDPNGKPAETVYEAVGSSELGSVIELHPKTGRTHQLRVHLDYIQCPIVGDQLYGGAAHDRLMLHAKELVIAVRPGHTMTFSAPLPEGFTPS